MEDQLVSLETAQLAKEKGFNTYSKSGSYNKDGRYMYEIVADVETIDSYGLIPAPTQSLLHKWLREVHGFNIQVYPMERWLDSGNEMEIYFEVNLKETNALNGLLNIKSNMLNFEVYEDALEEGLYEALKLIK